MKKIFESKYYPTIMFLLISITTIIIIFNFINIANDIAKISNNTDKKITGFVISKEKETTKIIEKPKINFTKKAFYIYNISRIILVILISLLSIRLIIQKISN